MNKFLLSLALFGLAAEARRSRPHGPNKVAVGRSTATDFAVSLEAEDDDDCDVEFNAWSATFNSGAMTASEWSERRANFSASNKRIREWNESGKKGSLVHNQFSAMTDDERHRATGLKTAEARNSTTTEESAEEKEDKR